MYVNGSAVARSTNCSCGSCELVYPDAYPLAPPAPAPPPSNCANSNGTVGYEFAANGRWSGYVSMGTVASPIDHVGNQACADFCDADPTCTGFQTRTDNNYCFTYNTAGLDFTADDNCRAYTRCLESTSVTPEPAGNSTYSGPPECEVDASGCCVDTQDCPASCRSRNVTRVNSFNQYGELVVERACSCDGCSELHPEQYNLSAPGLCGAFGMDACEGDCVPATDFCEQETGAGPHNIYHPQKR